MLKNVSIIQLAFFLCCLFTLFLFWYRLIFFAKSTEDNSKGSHYYEDKLKESRRQLVPLAHVLDLPENRTGDKIVGNALLDLRDVKEAGNRANESYESNFSDCSVSDDYVSN